MSLITQIFTVLNLTTKQQNDGQVGIEKVFVNAVEAYDYIDKMLEKTCDTKYEEYKGFIKYSEYCTIGGYNKEAEKTYYKIQAIDL